MMHFKSNRRQLIQAGALAALASRLPIGSAWAATNSVSTPLTFPRDNGAHLDHDIEWWYLTGFLQAAKVNAEPPIGFQMTFFRKRIPSAQQLTQQLAAKHLVFAHAALTWPGADGRPAAFHHDQRLARWNGVSDAADDGRQPVYVSQTHMAVRLGRGASSWFFQPSNGSQEERQTLQFDAGVHTDAFALDLKVEQTQPTVLQGRGGLSQKGPDPEATSWYTTDPQLRIKGQVTLKGAAPISVNGAGWLDHEWSHGFMPAQAVGWDWIGMNFDDGSALTAFQLRDANGGVVWTGGSWRAAGSDTAQSYRAGDLAWRVLSTWRSPVTSVEYPSQWALETPQGRFTIVPVSSQQELDSRATTGTIYWEGLSALRDNSGRRVAWGYLEMTGYGDPLTI